MVYFWGFFLEVLLKNFIFSVQLTTPDREIARIAATQHGHVTRSQLLSAGFDGNAIDYRVKRGRLVIRHRGVYAVGHVPPSPYARAMAAVLACGPGAVLSHRSAAALFGLIRWPRTLEVTAPTDHRVPGIHTHRSCRLSDVTTHYGIPTTTPARTLHDLAKILDPASLTRAVNDARLRSLLSADDLDPAVARRLTSGRTEAPTRSVFEDAFLAFLDRHRLPRPEVNQRIAGYEVDMLWRSRRLVAELDGRAYHDDFEHDRERDADLLAAGLRVVRVTWRRLTRAEHREAARFRVLLASLA
jgi:very-short-patch-repair endonuclease